MRRLYKPNRIIKCNACHISFLPNSYFYCNSLKFPTCINCAEKKIKEVFSGVNINYNKLKRQLNKLKSLKKEKIINKLSEAKQ